LSYGNKEHAGRECARDALGRRCITP